MHTLPPAVEQSAIVTIEAMRERGFNQPHKLTTTCKQVAVVILSKLNVNDNKAVRILTNRMVSHVLEKECA